MDIKKAAKETKKKIEVDVVWLSYPESISRNHVVEMLDKIISGKIKNEQAHRWLGWAQGIICLNCAATLDELKEINHAE